MKFLTGRLSAAAAVVLGASVAATAFSGGFGQDPQGDAEPGFDSAGGVIGQAFYKTFTVPYSRSDTETRTETLICVTNDSDSSVDVAVEWRYAIGTLAGTAGPLTIPPHEYRIFNTTSSSAENTQPYFPSTANAYRDTTADFNGYAYVYIGPNSGSGKNVVCDAALLVGIGDDPLGNAINVTDLKVLRNKDDGGVIVNRQKGD